MMETDAVEVQKNLADFLDAAIEMKQDVEIRIERVDPFPSPTITRVSTIAGVKPMLIRTGGIEDLVKRWCGGGNYRLSLCAPGIPIQVFVIFIDGAALPPLPVRIEDQKAKHQSRVKEAARLALDIERSRQRFFFKEEFPESKFERWEWPEVLEVYETWREKAFVRQHGLLGVFALMVARYGYDVRQNRHKKTWDGLRKLLKRTDQETFDRWFPAWMIEHGLHNFFWTCNAYRDEFLHVYEGRKRRLPNIYGNVPRELT